MFARLFRPRNVALLLLVLVIAAVVSAFASSITVGPTGVTAAEGSATMNNYTVSSVEYAIDAAGATVYIDSVTLTFAAGGPTSGTVEVQFTDGGTSYACNNGGSGLVWTCNLPADTVVVSTTTMLRVIAGDTTLTITP